MSLCYYIQFAYITIVGCRLYGIYCINTGVCMYTHIGGDLLQDGKMTYIVSSL